MIEWVRQRLHWPQSESRRSLPVDHQQACEIVSLCAGKPSDHQIMEQNVASYLAHMRRLGDEIPTEALQDRRSLKRAIADGMGGVTGEPDLLERLRWRSKLDREVQAPYTDRQVGQRLRVCLNDLQSVLPEFSAIPHQLYLVGGPLGEREGRFGGNSDLDLVMKVEPEHLEAARSLVHLLERADRKHTLELHVTGGQQFPAVAQYYGSLVALQEEGLGPQVEGLVRDGLGSQGLQVDERWQAHRTAWAEPTTLPSSGPFPRHSVTTLKA